jgi:hypothetical protein
MGELPPQPDEVTLEELLELARQLQAHPENRPGSDKTWVLEHMRSFQRLVRVLREEGHFLGEEPRNGPASPSDLRASP